MTEIYYEAHPFRSKVDIDYETHNVCFLDSRKKTIITNFWDTLEYSMNYFSKLAIIYIILNLLIFKGGGWYKGIGVAIFFALFITAFHFLPQTMKHMSLFFPWQNNFWSYLIGGIRVRMFTNIQKKELRVEDIPNNFIKYELYGDYKRQISKVQIYETKVVKRRFGVVKSSGKQYNLRFKFKEIPKRGKVVIEYL